MGVLQFSRTNFQREISVPSKHSKVSQFGNWKVRKNV